MRLADGTKVEIVGYEHDPGDGEDPNGMTGVIVGYESNMYAIVLPIKTKDGYTWRFLYREFRIKEDTDEAR
jgi:hypothetical protein